MSFGGSTSGANTSLKNNRDNRRSRKKAFEGLSNAYGTSFPKDKLNIKEQSPEELAEARHNAYIYKNKLYAKEILTIVIVTAVVIWLISLVW